MKLLYNIFSALALLAFMAHAAPAAYSPKSGITYSVAIPPATTSAGSGDIYLQLKAEAGYRWVAVGIGEGMAGATIFVMYTDGAGNVTVSPRSGTGHVMPQFNSVAQVTLLAGSGVVNGAMTANIKYTAAPGLLTVSSTSSDWICSWQKGSALDNKSPSATITQHDSYDLFTFDLSKATATSNSNPFVSSSGGSATGTGATSGQTSTPSNSGSGGGKADPTTIYKQTHGIIMGAVMVVLFPLGVIVLRVFGGVWLHAGIQMVGLVAILVGLGLGVRLGQLTSLLFNNTHTRFGVIIIALFLIQPILGLLHHRQYMKTGKRSYLGHSHIWYGRILITCGIVNGGLGLQLANNSPNGTIAYGIVAGVLFVLYIGALFFAARKQKKQVKSETA